MCVKSQCKLPVDCEVTQFTNWTSCSKTCGNGEQTRHRQITVNMQHNGKVCPRLNESKVCNLKSCTDNICAATTADGKCSVCPDCCKSYLPKGPSCDTCVEKQCPHPVNCGSQGKREKSHFPHNSNLKLYLYSLRLSEVSSWLPWTICSAECGGGNQVYKL